jgi:DNA-binding MarR family transcriptional regulator
MRDQTSVKASFFEDHFWLRGASPGLRPTLGQIGLQQFAPYLINSISLSWVSHLASALKAHDMTITQMRALAVLSISSPVTINELSQFALTEQSTMSRTLDSLEEQAFIVRKPRPEDLRVRDVEITQAGRDAFAKVWPTMYDLLVKMFEGIDSEEYKAFTATMHKMMSNVRKHGIGDAPRTL